MGETPQVIRGTGTGTVIMGDGTDPDPEMGTALAIGNRAQ